jgi:HNH endonuclease
LNPFLYPQSRYRRKLHPPSYSAYSRYKPFLKQEFTSQCVYCRLPDGLKGEDSFSVDHYRPQSKFPELVTTYANLFYACNGCNRRKGVFWPTDVQWQARQFIPNPCDHVMFDHLRYRSTRVEARSPAGELAERVLMLNDEHSVEYRELVLGVIAALEEKKRRVQETL